MKFAIYVPNFGEFADVRALAALAREAEEHGWDGFFIWDHVWPFMSRESPYRGREDVMALPSLPLADCWIALAAVALNTERIRLGPVITALARRRPHKLARETVTLDHLSRGRLTLGVGLGAPRDSEFARFGEDPDDKVRAAKLDEGLEVLTGLWSGNPFSYSGKYYQVGDVAFLPRPVQSPRIPIWVAGFWPHKPPMRRAARYDGVAPQHIYFEKQYLLPEDYKEINRYICEHRREQGPFDVIHFAGYNAQRDSQMLSAYAEAGITWWFVREAASMAAAREKVRRGPPAI